MQKLRNRYLIPLAAAVALVPAAIAAAPAGAIKSEIFTARGTENWSVVVVPIGQLGAAPAAADRHIKLRLTGTNLHLIGRRAIGTSRAAFSIKNAGFRLGGSEYDFDFRRLKSIPRNAKLVFFYGAGSAA